MALCTTSPSPSTYNVPALLFDTRVLVEQDIFHKMTKNLPFLVEEVFVFAE